MDKEDNVLEETIVDSNQQQNYRQAIYATYVSQKTEPAGHTHTEADYRRWALAAESRFSGWLPADRSTPVLDIGCGPGNFLFLLDQLGYTDVTGVDLSPEQVALAQKWCPRAKVVQGDVREKLAQNPKHFGLITGIDIVEHFNKAELLSLFTLMAQALRPEGRVILQTPNAESPWMGAVAYADFTHEWFFTPRSLADMLRLVGLSQFEARPSVPHVHGIKSLVRAVLWRMIDALLTIWNLAETGSRGSGIYTRVFAATAVKR